MLKGGKICGQIRKKICGTIMIIVIMVTACLTGGIKPVWAEEIRGVEDTLGFTARELKGDIKTQRIGDSLYIVLPELEEGFEYQFKLYEDVKDGELFKTGYTDELIDISKFIKYRLKLKLDIFDTDEDTKLMSVDVKISFDSIKAPEITCAYVKDSRLYITIEDQFGEVETIIEYSTDGKEYVELNRDYIRIDIPTDVIIVIRDIFDKDEEREEIFKINEDNVVLKGTPSKKVLKEIEEKKTSKVTRYRNINNLLEVEYGKKANILEELEKDILRKYGSYNDGDIYLECGDLKIEDGFVYFNKEGVFEVEVKHVFYTKDIFSVFVLIKEDNIYYTNIGKIRIKNPFIVYDAKIDISKYLDIEQIIEGYSPRLDFIFVRDMDCNEVFHISKGVILEKDELRKLEIIDLEEDTTYNITLKFMGRPELMTVSFIDLDYRHWAYNDIKEAALKMIVHGYPDETFKPDSNITVKEFMALLGRFVASQDMGRIQEVKNDMQPLLSMSDWAYIEVLSVINRLNRVDLNYFDTISLDRDITREEVALLISNNLEISETFDYMDLKDVTSSQYMTDVSKLVKSNIIRGYPDGTFKSKNKMTRAEVAAVLNRLSEVL